MRAHEFAEIEVALHTKLKFQTIVKRKICNQRAALVRVDFSTSMKEVEFVVMSSNLSPNLVD